ncbi:MAG TPA: hypothetical protein VG267_01715 [Terracidiphilus sp.]|jgi:hypothetical protein|nr:hypothetical protein [Terracidiphilus sp.]
MKIKLATLVILLAAAASALAQGDKSWTLVLSGRAICGTLKRDRGGKPFEFTTDRGVSVPIADYPSLTVKPNLRPGCSRIGIDSLATDEPVSEENAEKAREAAQKAKEEEKKAREEEKKEIERWLDEYCENHGDEPGCKE